MRELVRVKPPRSSDAATSAFADLPRPARRQNTYEVVAGAVVGLIRSRRLRPGDHIVTERELMETFAVGRSSVREALRVLESKGVIEGRRGEFVVAPLHAPVASALELLMDTTGTTLADLHTLRHQLEVEAAAAAAARCTTEALEAIETAEAKRATTLRAALAGSESFETAAMADAEFHAAIAEAAGNPLLVNVLTGVKVAAIRVYPYETRAGGDADAVVIERQHRAIIDAIAAGNPKRARTAMQRHLDWVLEAYSDDVADRPLFS